MILYKYVPFVRGVLQAKYPFLFIFLYQKIDYQIFSIVINPARVDIYSPFVAAMPDENNILILGSFCRFLRGFESHPFDKKEKNGTIPLLFRGSRFDFLFFIFSVSTAICWWYIDQTNVCFIPWFTTL